jgi:hypothetical protein
MKETKVYYVKPVNRRQGKLVTNNGRTRVTVILCCLSVASSSCQANIIVSQLLDSGVFTVVDVDWSSRCTLRTPTSPTLPALIYIAVPNDQWDIEMRYSVTCSSPYQRKRRTPWRRRCKSWSRKRKGTTQNLASA